VRRPSRNIPAPSYLSERLRLGSFPSQPEPLPSHCCMAVFVNAENIEEEERKEGVKWVICIILC
jgi:hypothetical protein